MLSSDKNVETFAQLIEVLKHYLGLQTEYVKLDVIDKVVRLMTAAALAILFFFIIIAVLMFFSFAFAFILVISFRKTWIEKPLVHFLASLLLSK